MMKKQNRFLMKGNEAMAEAAIQCGCKGFFGYPITPQTEISAYMAKRMPEIGGAYLQAESEIAAINMVLGAASTGKRIMTSSSSLGMSLKSEAISYIAGSDLPCLIINVQRVGPGLGGIQPAQSDYFQATKALGHGDFRVMVFSPSGVQEAVNLISKAFDLSDKYRVPALILTDSIVGQIMEPVSFSNDNALETNFKINKDWALTGHKNKRKPNIVNSLVLDVNSLEDKILERFERYKKIEKNETDFELYETDDADFIVVAQGSVARIVKTSINAARQKGIKIGLIRPITLYPFPNDTIHEYAKKVKGIICIEMNMGQMLYDVKVAVNGECPVKFYGRTGGCVPSHVEILEQIESMVKVVE